MEELHKDFYANYIHYTGTNQKELTKDMFFQELAKIIIFRRDEVIGVLRRSGVDVKEKVSDKELSKLLMANIENPKARYGFSIIIAKQNKKSLEKNMNAFVSVMKKRNVRAKAKKNKNKGKKFYNNLVDAPDAGGADVAVDPISHVAKAITQIFKFYGKVTDKVGARDEQRRDNDAKLWDRVIALKQKQEAGASRGKRTTMYVIGGVALLTVLIFGVIALKSVRKTA